MLVILFTVKLYARINIFNLNQTFEVLLFYLALLFGASVAMFLSKSELGMNSKISDLLTDFVFFYLIINYFILQFIIIRHSKIFRLNI